MKKQNMKTSLNALKRSINKVYRSVDREAEKLNALKKLTIKIFIWRKIKELCVLPLIIFLPYWTGRLMGHLWKGFFLNSGTDKVTLWIAGVDGLLAFGFIIFVLIVFLRDNWMRSKQLALEKMKGGLKT